MAQEQFKIGQTLFKLKAEHGRRGTPVCVLELFQPQTGQVVFARSDEVAMQAVKYTEGSYTVTA